MKTVTLLTSNEEQIDTVVEDSKIESYFNLLESCPTVKKYKVNGYKKADLAFSWNGWIFPNGKLVEYFFSN